MSFVCVLHKKSFRFAKWVDEAAPAAAVLGELVPRLKVGGDAPARKGLVDRPANVHCGGALWTAGSNIESTRYL